MAVFRVRGAAALLRLAQDACGTSYVASTAFVRTGACRAATAPFRHWATQEPLHQHSDRPQRTRQPIICMYSTVAEHQGQIDDINEDFTAAREEIDYAKEDAETTYFNESCETAREAVESVLNKYKQVLDALSEDERAKLQRSMGLKMEQLKAELQQLESMHS